MHGIYTACRDGGDALFNDWRELKYITMDGNRLHSHHNMEHLDNIGSM